MKKGFAGIGIIYHRNMRRSRIFNANVDEWKTKKIKTSGQNCKNIKKAQKLIMYNYVKSESVSMSSSEIKKQNKKL